MAQLKHQPLVNRALGYRGYQVLAYVRETIDHDGLAPSYAMISTALEMTKADVCKVVGRLEKRGLLSRVSSGKVRKRRGWRSPVIELVR